MEFLKLIGGIFAICFIYALLKEIGIFDLLWTIVGIVLLAGLSALGISFVVSLFGIAFEAALKIALPVCLIYVIVKMIKK